MKKSRFSEEQIIAILKQHQAGVPVANTSRDVVPSAPFAAGSGVGQLSWWMIEPASRGSNLTFES